VNVEHLLAFVETLYGANNDAIRVLAPKAGLRNNVSHGRESPSENQACKSCLIYIGQTGTVNDAKASILQHFGRSIREDDVARSISDLKCDKSLLVNDFCGEMANVGECYCC
jgi:hypothetical protein